MRALAIAASLFVLSACGKDDFELTNKASQPITIDLAGPKLTIHGGCEEDFRTRFCAEEFEPLGTIVVSSGETRVVTVFEEGESDQCLNLIWLRLLKLGGVGPVREQGTLLRLPSKVEVETGAGHVHTAAFPQTTLRIDEVGNLDENQGPEPEPCTALGREPR
jgi:hypothetical protein